MISTSTKYAMKALMFLASQNSSEYSSIEVLASEADVPRPYLAKLMKILASKGIVTSKKGLNGGFKIKEPRPNLTLFDLCVALDDPIIKDSCILGRATCTETGGCIAHRRWGAMKKQIRGFLLDFII